jgi:hypothetical protein
MALNARDAIRARTFPAGPNKLRAAVVATNSPPPLNERESEVMEELWRSGEASVRSVMEALNKRAREERGYTTYMTIMARPHKKGVLVRRREGEAESRSASPRNRCESRSCPRTGSAAPGPRAASSSVLTVWDALSGPGGRRQLAA